MHEFFSLLGMKFLLGMSCACWAVSGVPLSPGGPYNSSSNPQANRINVHLVPHTHDDVGWLKTVDELYLGGHNDIQISAVQFILDSVIDSLSANKDRKFIYVEMAFFSRWWRRQNPEKRGRVLELLESGQLEFINGGWDSNDEATPSFVDIIDQHTMGSTFIAKEFGSKFHPTIGWQVDPFGHSMFQAKAYSKMGMNAWFFGRSDSQDFAIRKATRRLESIHSSILAGSMDGYGPPSGFNWNIFSADDPLNDDEYLGSPNIESRVHAFIEECIRRTETYNDPSEPTKHIMLTMGSDFEYEYAHTWFSNMDKLIHYVNLDGRVNAFYSTPTIYTKSRSEQLTHRLEDRSDYDWFPYCDSDDTRADSNGNLIQVGAHAFWTGYFTSRPLLKRLVREASTMLELCRLVEIFFTLPSRKVEDKDNPAWSLWEALSVAQHHDGVSGTARQLVTDDYTRRLQEGMNSCEAHISTALSSDEIHSGESTTYTSIMTRHGDEPGTQESISYYFAYYNSSLGKTKERPDQASGAYIFRPDCPEGNVLPCRPTRLPANTPWIEHKIVNKTISWKVGPIPQDNGLIGKEIVLVIEAIKSVNNKGVFFTDSNGYQWMRREVNKRPTWKNVVTDPLAGNYYPITAGIAILDADRALIVSTDRSVGGTSLENNQIEIMIHRRTFMDDSRGVGEPINERTADGQGIVVEGKTFFDIVATKGIVNTVPVRVPINQLRPPIRLAGVSPERLRKLVNHFAPQVPERDVICTHFHRIDVPELCRLGKDEHDCVVARFSHRDVDGDRPVELDFNRMLPQMTVLNVTETALHAGRTLSDSMKLKINWNKTGTSSNPSLVLDGKVIMKPGEIRTFILDLVIHRPHDESEGTVIESI